MQYAYFMQNEVTKRPLRKTRAETGWKDRGGGEPSEQRVKEKER